MYKFAKFVTQSLEAEQQVPKLMDIERKASIGFLTKGGDCIFYAALAFCIALRYNYGLPKVYVKYASTKHMLLPTGEWSNLHYFCVLSTNKVFSHGKGYYRLLDHDIVIDGWPLNPQALPWKALFCF